MFLVYLVKVAFKIKQTANTNANLDIIDTGYFETMCMVNLSTMCMVNLSNTSVKLNKLTFKVLVEFAS